MKRNILFSILLFLVFLTPVSSSILVADTGEGQKIVSRFLAQIRDNNVSKAKNYVIKNDRKLLFVKNNQMRLRLYSGDVPLRKFLLVDQLEEQYSRHDQEHMALYYPVQKKERTFYIRFFLKKSSGEWKIRLRHSCIRSLATRFLSPLWTRSNDSKNWTYQKQIGYSQLTESTLTDRGVLTASKDGAIRRWNTNKPSSPQVLNDLGTSIYEMRLSPDQSMLMYRTDRTVHLRNLKQNEQVFQVQSLYKDEIEQRQHDLNGDHHDMTSFAVNWGKGVLMIGYKTAAENRGSDSPFPKGIVEFWDIRSGKQRASHNFDDAVVDVSISNDGQMAGVITKNKIYYGEMSRSVQMEPLDIDLRPDQLIITADPRSIYFLDGAKLQRYYPKSDSIRSLQINGIDNASNRVQMERFRNSERLAVFQLFDRKIHLVDGKTMEQVSRLDTNRNRVMSVRFMNSNRLLIGTTTEVLVGDLANNRVEQRVSGFREEVSEMEMFHGGSNVFVGTTRSTKGTDRSTLEVIDLETEDVLVRKKMQRRCHGFDISPDDSIVAMIAGTGKRASQGEMTHLRLLVKESETLSTILETSYKGMLSPPVISKKGNVLFGKGDEYVELVDPRENKVLHRFDVPERFRDNEMWLHNVQLSPNGKYVVGAIGKRTGLNNGKTYVLLWDRSSGEMRHTSDQINGLIKVLTFTPSSKRLHVGGKIKAYLTTFEVPNLKKVVENPYTIRLERLKHIKNQRYLFDAGDAPKPNHILNMEKQQFWTLPGVWGGTAESIDINREKNRIIGGFDTGELILWKRRKE